MTATLNETERTGWWVYASLVIAGLAAFWPSVWFDFVNWDDPAYVLHNDLITSWSPSNLWGVATETVTRNYAPLTILSLLIDHTLWGMNSGGYHATNVLLHIVNGLLGVCSGAAADRQTVRCLGHRGVVSGSSCADRDGGMDLVAQGSAVRFVHAGGRSSPG